LWAFGEPIAVDTATGVQVRTVYLLVLTWPFIIVQRTNNLYVKFVYTSSLLQLQCARAYRSSGRWSTADCSAPADTFTCKMPVCEWRTMNILHLYLQQWEYT
jgi:hypothetical protein